MARKNTRAEALAKLANDAPLTDEELEAVEAGETAEAETPSEPVASEEETQVVEAEAPTPEPASEANHTSQLLELTKACTRYEIKIEQLEATIAENAAATEAARAVIRTAAERLGVALNSTVAGLESLSLAALCTQFHALNKTFEERFSIGAKSKVEAPEDSFQPKNDATARRIKASRIDKGDK